MIHETIIIFLLSFIIITHYYYKIFSPTVRTQDHRDLRLEGPQRSQRPDQADFRNPEEMSPSTSNFRGNPTSSSEVRLKESFSSVVSGQMLTINIKKKLIYKLQTTGSLFSLN